MEKKALSWITENHKESIKFSIITPVYNCERYLETAINSVINQSYTNWELILVDDGSTDHSYVICKKYKNEKRIKLFQSQENMGAMQARMLAIEHTSGDYLIGLDGDDWFEKDAFMYIYKMIMNTECDIVTFRWRDTLSNTPSPLQYAEGKYNGRNYLELAILNTKHSLSDKAIRMECIRKANWMLPDRRLSINADYLQIIPILCQAQSVYVTSEILYNYRILNTSMSHNVKLENIIDTDYVSLKVIDILSRANLLDEDIYDAVHFAYVTMIDGRLQELLGGKSILDSDIKKIKELEFYSQCEKYESSKRFTYLTRRFFREFRREDCNYRRLRIECKFFELAIVKKILSIVL